MKMRMPGLLLVAAVLTLAVSGCGRSVPSPPQNPTGTPAPQNSTGAGHALPSGLPSGVPVYSGRVSYSNEVHGTTFTTFNIHVDTPDNVQTVVDWYVSQMMAGGYAFGATSLGPGTTVSSSGTANGKISLPKGYERYGAMVAGKVGTTRVSVVVEPEGGAQTLVIEAVNTPK